MSKPKIEPLKDGPYKATGIKEMMSAHGKVSAEKETVFLCRCGGSKNKPYCDGAHSKNGFSSDKEEGRTPNKKDVYEGDDIKVFDNRGLCAHAGRCTDGLPKVFRLREEPFVDAKAESAEAIAKVIHQCPSGALSYETSKNISEDAPAPTVFIAPNGPYVVKSGAAELNGVEWQEGASKENFTLCRCGASKNKPFCNGAHWNVPFDEKK